MSNEQQSAKPTRRTVEDQKADIQKKMEQLSAKLAKLDAKERDKQRKEETRAKIVIGGFILSEIANGDDRLRKWAGGQITKLPDRDKQIVEAAIQRAVDRRPPPSPTAQTPPAPTKGTGG